MFQHSLAKLGHLLALEVTERCVPSPQRRAAELLEAFQQPERLRVQQRQPVPWGRGQDFQVHEPQRFQGLPHLWGHEPTAAHTAGWRHGARQTPLAPLRQRRRQQRRETGNELPTTVERSLEEGDCDAVGKNHSVGCVTGAERQGARVVSQAEQQPLASAHATVIALGLRLWAAWRGGLPTASVLRLQDPVDSADEDVWLPIVELTQAHGCRHTLAGLGKALPCGHGPRQRGEAGPHSCLREEGGPLLQVPRLVEEEVPRHDVRGHAVPTRARRVTCIQHLAGALLHSTEELGKVVPRERLNERSSRHVLLASGVQRVCSLKSCGGVGTSQLLLVFRSPAIVLCEPLLWAIEQAVRGQHCCVTNCTFSDHCNGQDVCLDELRLSPLQARL
mmetsp:Transcript_88690/g.287149  ORF Transcript_88690/g.287149 Transcript_88690/m.287149 type:complete len:390 (+) Transcript_88690:1215-2384(+)